MIRSRISLLLCLASLFFSCGHEDTPSGEKTDERSMQLKETQIEIDYREGAFTVPLTANFDYSVDIQADWISRVGSGLEFNVSENTGSTSRTGTIRFSDASDRYFYKVFTVVQKSNPVQVPSLSIVDKNATGMTKALFANLWLQSEKGFMFGHHDDLWYGRYWYDIPGNSDTKAVCGDYPAVFSVDFGPIMDNRYLDGANSSRRRAILEARKRGEVVIACAHLNNPLTGGDSWDNSSTEVVKSILRSGSETRKVYLEWLDRLADFANALKDENGNLVPVIFRPYHEHTQTWSWWGSSCTTSSDFVSLWRMTVTYLRDTKGVHNFLYAVSPQMDGTYQNAEERLLSRWPGDDYVDFIGMDCYHGNNISAFKSNLEAIEKLSMSRRKPCGVTETGSESFTETDFWTVHILEPLRQRRISMVVMWRNKYVADESDKHYYSVYPGHPSEADFRKMYADGRSIFSADLPDMYTSDDSIKIK